MTQRIAVLGASAALLFSACTSEKEGGLPGINVDGSSGGGGRFVPDGGFRDGGYDPDDAPIATNVIITIAAPAADAVVVAKSRFAPRISVAITSASSADNLMETNAFVFRKRDRLMVAAAKLQESRLDTVGMTTTHVFDDTPLDIAAVKTDVYELLVSARLQGGSKAEATVSFRADAGPVITIVSPKDKQAFRGVAPVTVDIVDPLFGPVSNVEMMVGQQRLTHRPPAQAGESYTASVDFTMNKLEGELLLKVTAQNMNGTRAEEIRLFVSDNTGPEITNTIPAVGDLIGRIVNISAEVKDPSGVLDSSVVAVIANGDVRHEVRLDPPRPGAAIMAYTGVFDTSILPKNVLYPSVSFRAQDKLGNEFSSVGYLVSLDNTPPLADLDPPEDMRVLTKQEFLICSWPFDPVGPDAVDDGNRVAQFFDVRARIEDRGNSPLSGEVDFVPISLVSPTGAQLFILDDTSQPLVVDTDADGICDDINPTLQPTTMPMTAKDAMLITLAPLATKGTADNTFEPGSTCPGDSTKVPDPVCETTYRQSKAIWWRPTQAGDPPFTLGLAAHSYEAWYIPFYTNGKEPSLWTIPPIREDKVQCMGRQMDALGSNLSDGWACLAIKARDRLNNHQVSRVLRVCIDKDGVGNECPHRPIQSVTGDTPPIVTAAGHGLANGAEVYLSDIFPQTQLNQVEVDATTHQRKPWRIQRIDNDRFAVLRPDGVNPAPGHANLGTGTGGLVVPAAALPNCTGTYTLGAMPPVGNTPCRPWRYYAPGAMIRP